MSGRRWVERKMTFSSTTGAGVSPTTYRFHTPSLEKDMWRVQSETPTANASVGSAHMRVLRSQRSAKREPMHSLMQTQPHLWKETPDMAITMVTVKGTVKGTVMGMVMGKVTGIMEILKVFTPMALAMTMITTMAIMVEIMMATAEAMGSIKLSKEQGSKKLKYLKGKIS